MSKKERYNVKDVSGKAIAQNLTKAELGLAVIYELWREFSVALDVEKGGCWVFSFNLGRETLATSSAEFCALAATEISEQLGQKLTEITSLISERSENINEKKDYHCRQSGSLNFCRRELISLLRGLKHDQDGPYIVLKKRAELENKRRAARKERERATANTEKALHSN